jgi:uncharacterized protein YyaL (SSP411 family)
MKTLADATLQGTAIAIATDPLARTDTLLAVERATDATSRLLIALPAGADRAQARPFLDVFAHLDAPSTEIVVATDDALAGPLGARLPWAKGKASIDGKATAFVCAGDACTAARDAADLAKRLATPTPYPQGAPKK